MGFDKCKEKRKLKRYTNVLEKTFNIHVTDCPSNVLAICNGGLTNGLSQEKIFETFNSWDVTSIEMPPGQSISFVCFQSKEKCQQAMETVSKTSLDWEGGGPAFLAFVDRMPEVSEGKDVYTPPPGLIIIEEFITTNEENHFLKCIGMEENTCNLKHRDVKHFGLEFSYSDNRADTESQDSVPAIPYDFDVLWDRLLETNGLEFHPNQCTVNRYAPGQGIPPHVDTHSAFTEVIVCLSLQADIVMDWRQGGQHRRVLVPRRSLSIFSGDSRYSWTHGLTPRKSDMVAVTGGGLTLLPRHTRTSVTFRRTRTGPCTNCRCPPLCDSITATTAVEEKQAANLENASVHQVYEEIAEHFSMTRHKPWPNVVKFINSFNAGDIILDVGCGNGKYLGVRDDLAVVGLDRSASLLQLCNSTYPMRSWLTQADCLQLPIRDNCADGAISIAVLHHLSTKERRFKGIKEIVRVLKPGGRCLIYVWARNQQADESKSNYLRQRNEKKSESHVSEVQEVQGVCLPVHTNRTNFVSADMLVPWQEKTSGATFLRFYHVFEEEELREMCHEVTDAVTVEYYYDQGNWCIILEKIENTS